MFKSRRGALRKSLLEAPVWLFRSRLGFLAGKRFICIQHEGRNTGRIYFTTVEVIYRDKTANEYYAVSARGERSDWFRNVSKYPATAVYIGSRKRRVDQRIVPIDEAVAAMQIYQQKHRKAAAAMLELAGVDGDPSPVAWRSAMEVLPMVAFRPR
jgi:deazaflavin-dependent oxidoreductase (nitroreductase family)